MILVVTRTSVFRSGIRLTTVRLLRPVWVSFSWAKGTKNFANKLKMLYLSKMISFNDFRIDGYKKFNICILKIQYIFKANKVKNKVDKVKNHTKKVYPNLFVVIYWL